MKDELKQLIEDAAKLLCTGHTSFIGGEHFDVGAFNPCDPERGDLMKVADAAGLVFGKGVVADCWINKKIVIEYAKGDHQSKAYAILRAASAVYKSRGGV